jgi:hypothetical protein
VFTLNQSQVDRLAAFTEVCSELASEPFFRMAEPLPNFRASSDWKRVTYLMGNRVEFRAGLIPFCRIWSLSEPAHWSAVIESLNAANLPPNLNWSLEREAKLIRGEIERHELSNRIPLPAGRVIDLWLNAIVIHSSWDKRREWESALDHYGHAPLDYAFRSAVKTLGYHFQRLADYVVGPALVLAKTELSLVPSFAVGAARAIKKREQTPDGAHILREGIAEYGPDETLEERYRRLVDAYDNQSLGRILTRLEASQGEIMRAVFRCSDFAECKRPTEYPSQRH